MSGVSFLSITFDIDSLSRLLFLPGFFLGLSIKMSKSMGFGFLPVLRGGLDCMSSSGLRPTTGSSLSILIFGLHVCLGGDSNLSVCLGTIVVSEESFSGVDFVDGNEMEARGWSVEEVRVTTGVFKDSDSDSVTMSSKKLELRPKTLRSLVGVGVSSLMQEGCLPAMLVVLK